MNAQVALAARLLVNNHVQTSITLASFFRLCRGCVEVQKKLQQTHRTTDLVAVSDRKSNLPDCPWLVHSDMLSHQKLEINIWQYLATFPSWFSRKFIQTSNLTRKCQYGVTHMCMYFYYYGPTWPNVIIFQVQLLNIAKNQSLYTVDQKSRSLKNIRRCSVDRTLVTWKIDAHHL